MLTPISETFDPEVFMAPINGRLYEFVDTPGFGDTRRTDEEILRCISEYFAARHASGELFHGVIYLHSIAHTRVSGSMMAQIRAFKAICGSGFFSRLVIGSTFWETMTDLSIALANEQQLFFSSDGYFEDVIDLGAQTTRVFQTYEACLEAVLMVPDDEPLPLQIQSELEGDADFNHTTAAASILPAEQLRLQQEHERQMREEQEAAERQRLDGERRAAEEADRVARAIAEVEQQRLLELQRRQREYEEAERQRMAAERQRQIEREAEMLAADHRRREAALAAERKAEAERKAADQRRAEEEEARREREQREQRMREHRAQEQAQQARLKRMERSREGYRSWHISWVSSISVDACPVLVLLRVGLRLNADAEHEHSITVPEFVTGPAVMPG